MTVIAVAISTLFAACSTEADNDGTIPDYDISDLYGYTYSGTVSASSGNTLTPEMTIYDSTHVEWNMSSSSMSAATYYYNAEETAQNVYKLYWYASESERSAASTSADTSSALMSVTLGINSTNSISVIGMGTTVVEMSRTGDTQKTYSGDDDDTDETTVPEITILGDSAAWAEESSAYTGSLSLIVMGTNYADSSSYAITVTKGDDNTVSITSPAVSTSMMSISSFTVDNVAVTKDGDVYYLYAESFTATAGTVTVNGSSLKGKLDDGVLTLVLVYRPGAMPLDITEVFTSTQTE